MSSARFGTMPAFRNAHSIAVIFSATLFYCFGFVFLLKRAEGMRLDKVVLFSARKWYLGHCWHVLTRKAGHQMTKNLQFFIMKQTRLSLYKQVIGS